MTDELIEAIARAIWQPGDSWTEHWPKRETKELHRRLARAALQAIEASGTHLVVRGYRNPDGSIFIYDPTLPKLTGGTNG